MKEYEVIKYITHNYEDIRKKFVILSKFLKSETQHMIISENSYEA